MAHFFASPGEADAPSVETPAARRLSADGFASLYQTHHRALWCIAAAIVNDRNAAYDVVQEAAMTALSKLDEFDASTSFPAWAGQIVRFVALNHRRRGVRSRAIPTDPGVMAASARAGHDGLVRDFAFSAKLAAALDELEETARACLLMRTVMDMTYKQIAEALSIPEGTAMSHAHRSRSVLRRKLGGGDDGGRGGQEGAA